MASALIENLSAASALATTDLFYVKQAGARGLKATGTQLLALVGTAYVPLAGGTMTGALTLPAGAVGTPKLMFTGAGATTGFYSTGSNNVSLAVNGARVFSASDGIIWAEGVTGLGTTAALYIGATGDVRLFRDAAATLAQRNGTNAQTFKVYGTTDAGLTNYERLAISAQQGVGFTIGAETLGTGGDNLDIVLTPAGTGRVVLPLGSAANPSLSFASGLGVYGRTSSILALSVGGSERVSVTTSTITVRSDAFFAFSSTTDPSASQDTAISRNAAGIIEVNNNTAGTYRDLKARNLITNPVAFASLTAAATAGNGARAMITNCSHATFGTAADGGGSTKVPVYSDGASWLVG